MARTLSNQQLLALAHSIVERWESVESKADAFQGEFDTTDDARNAYAESARNMIGGEEVYLAAKAAIASTESADASNL
jgi:hypothetical protein